MKNYSQNNEQEIILNYFGDFKGRFLDIGAYNGVDISNTRALLELGWSGVLVEPNPFNLVDLIKNCREFGDRAKIYCCGSGTVAPVISQLRLDESPGRGWAATFVDANPGVLLESKALVMVPMFPVGIFFSQCHFDLISIDAEWMDDMILVNIPDWELEKCRMLIIEPVGGLEGRANVKWWLTKAGFRIHAETPENIIAAK